MFLIPKNHRSPDQYGKQSVQIFKRNSSGMLPKFSQIFRVGFDVLFRSAEFQMQPQSANVICYDTPKPILDQN